MGVLRGAMGGNRVAHSYLFAGPSGVGKSTAALLFAQALNCEHPGDSPPCGGCRSCRLITQGAHPDVRILRPGMGKKKSVISIEELRDQFVYDVQLKPVMGRYKVYVLDHIEHTAHLAVHTILKTLEEPPPYVVTIVVSDAPAELPSTIPSRCQKVTFQLAGSEAIEQQLTGLGLARVEAAALARLSGGRIAWALMAAQRPEVLAARRLLLDLCASLEGRGMGAVIRVAEEVKLIAAGLAPGEPAEEDEAGEEPAETEQRGRVNDRQVRAELPWCLEVMASWYRDLMAVCQDGAVLNPDYEAVMKSRAHASLCHQAECAIESILEARHAIERNANVDLALEALAITLVGGCE